MEKDYIYKQTKALIDAIDIVMTRLQMFDLGLPLPTEKDFTRSKEVELMTRLFSNKIEALKLLHEITTNK